MNDPLNAEIDDEIYIDTKDLCKRVAYELKVRYFLPSYIQPMSTFQQHSIPQAIFAERILCRSQGTLSDLLRNPKPWNRLKSGRETFKRMYNWLQQPLHIRLSILDMYKGKHRAYLSYWNFPRDHYIILRANGVWRNSSSNSCAKFSPSSSKTDKHWG